jgi:hypothetical protein
VDNLPPTQPTNPVVRLATGIITLEWTPPPDPDVAGYWIYRSSLPNFLPVESNRIGSSAVNRFSDRHTEGASHWYYRIAAFDSSGNEGTVSEEVEAIVGTNADRPTEFVLYQNFPNPFNPTTTIQFDVPFASHVSLRVFDMLGREVAVLVDGVQQAGRHEAVWHATGVSSGVYMYRMQALWYLQTRKLILLK